MDIEELVNRFAYHPATVSTAPLHERIRQEALLFASYVLNNTPPGRHQSLALTAIQEAMMWANAAVACDSPNPKVEN